MNLTSALRRSIRSAVLADVPQGDFSSQARGLLEPQVAKKLPSDTLRKAYAENPEFFERGYPVKNLPHGLGYLRFPVEVDAEANKAVFRKLQTLSKKASSQKTKRQDLTREVGTALESVRTVKQLVERFPEWTKYAPQQERATANLPAVISNVIPDLKAAGWKP